MTWYPMAYMPQQYEDLNGNPYSGAVLKAYRAGTSTPILMATNYTGTTTAGSFQLNSAGYPVSSGNVIIPHIEENYDLALYPTQAAADANSGALWTIPNLQISSGTNVDRYLGFASDTGVANAYVVAPTPAISEYSQGQVLTLIPAASVSGASTLQVSGLATKSIKLENGSDLFSGAMIANGAYQLLYNGTNWILMNPESRAFLQSGTELTTVSGTTKDYTIPAGVKRIILDLLGVSLSSTAHLLVQIGPSSTPETTGYVSCSGYFNNASGTDTVSSTSGFIIYNGTASQSITGRVCLDLLATNKWVASMNLATSGGLPGVGAGSKTVASEINILRLTSTGADTFDAGSINISYEF